MQITEGRGAYGATDAFGSETLSQVIALLRKGGTGVIRTWGAPTQYNSRSIARMHVLLVTTHAARHVFRATTLC